MKFLLCTILILVSGIIYAQKKTPEDFGFRHMQTVFKKDTVHILIRSKAGDEFKVKPLLLFCQGSLPQPLIKYDEEGAYNVFPFDAESLTDEYHLAIISKPSIPVVSATKLLGKDFTYQDNPGKFPQSYTQRNLLNYYVNRNIKTLRYLRRQKWISTDELVVAGHSEGSTIAAKVALKYPKVTHLIYSGGNPMGRIMSMIGRSRTTENDSLQTGEDEILYWKKVVENKSGLLNENGDTFAATFGFSLPPISYLQKLKIPVFICYGTKDWSSPFNDFLRIETIRKGKTNFTFKAYVGTDHNYFPLLPNGDPNFAIYNWTKVGIDWKNWLKPNKQSGSH